MNQILKAWAIGALLTLIGVFTALCILMANASAATLDPAPQLENPIEIKGQIINAPPMLLRMFIVGDGGQQKVAVMPQILKEFRDRIKNGDRRIDMAINSPGGETEEPALMLLADMKKAREDGVEIRCYVDEMAASLAFAIFSNCTKRLAKPTAQLLWHSVRVMIPPKLMITELMAKQLLEHLQKTNALLWARLIEITGDEEFVTMIRDQEVVWTASVLSRYAPNRLVTLVQ